MARQRRNFSGTEKMAILREHLIDKVPVPFFWLVTHQIARNHKTNGVRVPSKIVPAVTVAWYPQAVQTRRPRLAAQYAPPWHRGQANPCGQRRAHRYSRQASSDENCRSSSISVRG